MAKNKPNKERNLIIRKHIFLILSQRGLFRLFLYKYFEENFFGRGKCNYFLHKYCSLWKLEMVKCRQVEVKVYLEEFPFAFQTRSNLMFRPIYYITNELTGMFRNVVETCLQDNC